MKNFFKNWDNPISKERLELVFNNRNHQYGAYTIRRDYNTVVLRAFFLTTLSLFLLLSLPSILKYMSPAKLITKNTPTEVILNIEEVILPDKVVPPLEKIIPDPPKSKGPAEKFTAIVASDKDSLEDAKTQEELLKLKLAASSTKGDSTEKKDDLPDLTTKSGGETGKVHKWVEVMPAFPGGEEAMFKYLSGNIRYPAEARESNLSGTVYISFVVDKNGEIGNIKTERGIGAGCEEEAIRVIKKMPVWSPGKQNGQAVNVQYMLPVSFRLK